MKLYKTLSKRAREKRAAIFRKTFNFTPDTKILDLGSEEGAHIHAAIQGLNVRPENVYIADISRKAVEAGQRKYGFTPVVISESGRLDFPDQFFDVIFCSSVIEHVTLPKEEIWTVKSGREFRERSLRRQQEFAAEIMRLGKRYFVQTPYRHFPLESHTLLPFVNWFPRPILIPTIRIFNTFWIKKTTPDWNLLTAEEMSKMFPAAHIVRERSLGMTKSLMAVLS